MIGDPDGGARQFLVQQFGQMDAARSASAQRQVQHLVEIAVVDVALPVHRDQVPAHHRRQVLVPVRGLEQVHVGLELPLGQQLAAEPLDRHVGQSQQMIERDPVADRQFVFIRRFQIGLIGR